MKVALHSLRVFTIAGGDGEDDEPLVTLIPSEPIDVGEGSLLEVCEWRIGIFIGTVIREWKTKAGTQIIHAVATSVSSNTGEYDGISRLICNVKAVKEKMSNWEWEQVVRQLKELIK